MAITTEIKKLQNQVQKISINDTKNQIDTLTSVLLQTKKLLHILIGLILLISILYGYLILRLY